MKERLTIRKDIPYEVLKALYSSEKNSRIKTRLLTLLLVLENNASIGISKILKQSDATVRKTIHRYNKFGLEGLKDIKHPPKETILNTQELNIIDDALTKSPRESGLNYNNWTGELLVKWISLKFDKKISIGTAYNIFKQLNYSKTRAKKSSKKADEETLNKFREDFSNLINSKSEDTVILYEDEAIVTSETSATSVWTKVGTQPIVKTLPTGTRKRKVIYGATNPETGDLTYQLSDKGNTDNFKLFLK
ncbi:IS630 family transposase [Clostridium tarantellae]|uniref:IS630 family transposase n=1 Tax=Clostridium tarantellae TaxID=39493 RepID=A0A6I1MLG9_9CLOT|nr:IS630 family transposase [Clostridium tarantellae]MPQ42957.1 IS630 family transposase [Clostridium tarantellae]